MERGYCFTTVLERVFSMDALLSFLTEQLTQAEPIKQHTLDSIDNVESYSSQDVEQFVTQGLPTLEEYEVDLVFSPQFTPSTCQLSAAHDVLGVEALTTEQQAQCVESLLSKALKKTLQLASGETVEVPLDEVMIERFVSCLRLTRSLSEELQAAVKRLKSEQGDYIAISREAVLEHAGPNAIAVQLLSTIAAQETETQSVHAYRYAVASLKTYKPKTADQFEEQLNRLIESCKDDMEQAQNRSYHSDQVKSKHLGSESDYYEAEAVKRRYELMIAEANAVIDLLRQACPA